MPEVTTAIIALGTNDIGQAKRGSKEYVKVQQITDGMWDLIERLARNASTRATGRVTIRLFGFPAGFAASLGLTTA